MTSTTSDLCSHGRTEIGDAASEQGYAEWQQNPLQVRREWMELLHMDPDEIEELCHPSQHADLHEELAQLDAAHAILERNRNRRIVGI